jgi:steroid 5-alpha reductase family enzyme
MKILQLFFMCVFCSVAGLSAASHWSPLVFIARADPLYVGAVICASVAAACFLLAWITGDYSQTDRLWSIMPPVYACYFAVRGWPDSRLALMALLALLWGARLTFNFARKGGYTMEEDYRWAVLKQKITNPAAWQIFNFLFIAAYQHLLVFLIVLPAYVLLQNPAAPPGAGDIAVAAIFILLLILETIADQQMWNFQSEKTIRKTAKKPLTGEFKRGFISSGVFRYSRHPNYFAEVMIWWAFYLFMPSATGSWLHWSIIGAALLSLLFWRSILFTESISAGKYPEYEEYKRRVSAFIPWFSRSMNGK